MDITVNITTSHGAFKKSPSHNGVIQLGQTSRTIRRSLVKSGFLRLQEDFSKKKLVLITKKKNT